MTRPQTRQAIALLRDRIALLPHGAALPTVAQLVRELSVSRTTIDRAYAALAKERVVERRPRKGVFVASRVAQQLIAIVLRSGALGPGAPVYPRMTAARLIESLHERQPDWTVRMHLVNDRVPSSADATARLHERELPGAVDLQELRGAGELRGVFTFHRLFDLERRLLDSGVAVVNIGRSHGLHGVHFDMGAFFFQAVAHLQQRGCRRVALIARPGWMEPFHLAMASSAMTGDCRFVFGGDGRTPSEQGGFESVCRLWSAQDRPDGLLIPEDVICQGAVRALMHLGVQTPEDVKLITFAVRGIDIPYHRLLTRIEFDPEIYVRRASAMMLELIAGRQPGRSIDLVAGELVQGQTT